MKIQLKRSNVLQSGAAKEPTASQLEYGELAINYNNSDPAIFLKDSNNNIIRISGVGNIADDGLTNVPDGTTPPTNPTPEAGNLWYNSDEGRLYIYYVDGNTSQWVDASPDSWDPTVMPVTTNPAAQSGTLDDRYVMENGDTMTGALLLDNAASASAPDLSFDGDANTGIYSPGADQVAISTGGTSRLFVDASGNVGIGDSPNTRLYVLADAGTEGQTSPISSEVLRLRRNAASATGCIQSIVAGTAGTAIVAFGDKDSAFAGRVEYDNATDSLRLYSATAERLRIDSSGRLLVGTSSSTNSNALLKVQAYAGNTSAEGQIAIAHGTSAPPGYIGALLFTDSNDRAGALIAALRDGGTWTSGSSHPSYLSFQTTANGASTTTERMRIDSSGSVGVGTTSPSSYAETRGIAISGANRAGLASYSSQSASDTTGFLNMYANSSDGFKRFFDIGVVGSNSGGTGSETNIRLITQGSSGAPVERLRIDSSGNVGIGNASPSSYNSSADNLVVGDTGSNGITIVSGTTNQGSLFFADGTSGSTVAEGYLVYEHTANYLALGTNNTERIRINNSGYVGIGTTAPQHPLHVASSTTVPSLLQNTSSGSVYLKVTNTDSGQGHFGYEGKRLVFYADNGSNTGATRVAFMDADGLKFFNDTAAANALHDYEEGTWTPTLPMGGTVSNVYNATYTKVGRLVTAYFYMQLSSVPNNVGEFRIGGLPYNGGIYTYYGGGTIAFSNTFNVDPWRPLVVQLGNYIYFHRVDGNSAAGRNSNFTGISELLMQVTYFAT